eukprot:7388604-Prymnesium_polylepis.1
MPLSVRVGQADWEPEHLVVHGVGVVDLVPVGGAPRAEVVVLVGAGAGALLDEEQADDAGAVGERAAGVLVVVAGDVIRARGVEAPALGALLREVEVEAGHVLGEQ